MQAMVATAQTDAVSYQQAAQQIKQTYESQLFILPAFKSGHYGLRMYRQTLDEKYHAAIWNDMARVASKLNRFAEEIYTEEQINAYSKRRLNSYADDTDERSRRRYNVTRYMPEYLYLGVDLLGSMARANEYGLKHRDDKKLRQVIRRYDFSTYATNATMVEAWAAQLANQVYWLRQLGEQDVVDQFLKTFRLVYPDEQDSELSSQQYGNKIYGMTHIIFAQSEYYQTQVDVEQNRWIYDYFRRNIDTIIENSKEDVIAEVGISFLLAGLDNDPVVAKTRKAIRAAIDKKRGMIPSVSGDFDLTYGEHRNVLAIMLLDWQGVHRAPVYSQDRQAFVGLPFGLVPIDDDSSK